MTAPEERSEGRMARSFRLFLRYFGGVAFAGYCVWNVYWLVQARIPPSIFLVVTGWPAPTTGGTRAIVRLCHGDWQESLRYNAMALPLIFLLLLSLAWLGGQALARKRLNLPLALFWAWVVVLGVAWVLKLTGDPMYW
jgi:hypothetical protein